MGNQKPIPTMEEIRAALRASEAGKGRRLAELVKNFSVEDLAAAFGYVRLNVVNDHGLHRALHFAAGLREERAAQTERRRQWRREQRTERRDKT